MIVQIQAPFLCFDKNFDFLIQEGEVNVLTGPPSSGKTLLMESLNFLLTGGSTPLKFTPPASSNPRHSRGEVEDIHSWAKLYDDFDKLISTIHTPTDFKPPTLKVTSTIQGL